jgi:hypothetical protein
MRSIYRTIWEEPLNAYDRFCEDLRQTDRILQKYQCLVSDLVGPRDYSREVEFPPVPANDDIAKSWLSSRSKVKQATRPAETPPSLVDLAATGEFSATYLASLANGKGNSVPADPRFWICTRRKELDNPVTARHLITVVLIQELFGGGEFYVGSYALGIYRTMQGTLRYSTTSSIRRLTVFHEKTRSRYDAAIEWPSNFFPRARSTRNRSCYPGSRASLKEWKRVPKSFLIFSSPIS